MNLDHRSFGRTGLRVLELVHGQHGGDLSITDVFSDGPVAG